MTDARILKADARAVLPTMPDDSFDAVITDIPYTVVNRPTHGLRVFDKADADSETFPLSFVVEQAARLAIGSVYIWCGTEQVSELRAGFVDKGMSTRLCIWEKSNPSPANGQHLWLSSIECCVFARWPKAYFARHCKSPVWRGPVVRGKLHPTQKPVWLMRELVTASVPEGGTVLDFCAGSGSTGVACIETKRNFVGVEISGDYCTAARERLDDAMTTACTE